MTRDRATPSEIVLTTESVWTWDVPSFLRDAASTIQGRVRRYAPADALLVGE